MLFLSLKTNSTVNIVALTVFTINKILMIALVLFSVLQVKIQFSALNKLIYSYLNDKSTSHMSVGASIRNVQNGSEIFSHNSNAAMPPASTFKLLSTGAFLEKFGTDYRFVNNVYTYGIIKNGVLEGDLIIENDYDPSFMSSKFNLNSFEVYKNLLSKNNINKIEGKIIVKQDKVDQLPINWLIGDVGNYYGTIPRKFIYNENIFRIYFNSNAPLDSKAEVLESKPILTNYEIKNLVKIAPNGTGDNVNILNYPGSREIILTGTVPQANGNFEVKGALSFPEEAFAEDLKNYLNQNYIVVNNKSYAEQGNKYILQQLFSSPASELARLCNFESNNLIADTFAKKLGDSLGSYSAFIKDFSLKKGLDLSNFRFHDGSGLSTQNTISTSALAAYLVKLKDVKGYYQSLPVVGKEGTVASLDSKKISKGRIRAKSGTISISKNYAGYIEAKNGQLYSFAFYVQGVGENQERTARKFLESLMIQMSKSL